MNGTGRFAPLTAITVLVALATACWLLLVQSESVMATMHGEGLLMDLAMAMMRPAATAPYVAASALMWVVMMAAMMTPAVLPMVVMFSRLDRGGGRVDATVFAGGYLLVWTGFALVATRSEEHTSELQSLRHLVCRLLLETKTRDSNR